MRTQIRPILAWPAAACALILGVATLGSPTYGQTPWEAAPAKPALLPGTLSQNATPKFNSLPLPPAATEPLAGQGPPPQRTSLIPSTMQPEQIGAVQAQLPPWPSAALPAATPGTNSAGVNSGLPALPDPGTITLPLPYTANAPLAAAPSTTPGALISYASQARSEGMPAEPRPTKFQMGELVAVVGTDHILAGDMNVFIEPIIEQNRDKIRDEEQEAAIRLQLTRQVLKQYVEVKALYQEFFRDMVGTGSPKELADMKKQVVTKAGKIFFEKQVPTLFEKYEVNDVGALEEKLRAKSMSLITLRNQFVEQVLSGELERKYIPDEYEVDREELFARYHENREEWEVPARARWRQLTIRYANHNSRQSAEELIKNLGNQIYLGGKSFDAVAKQSSEGFTAKDGGIYDWTTQGSLKSKQLDDAIFSLPLRRLSTVIEDELGFHIIEVLEREAAHTKDLAISQAEIRKSISREKREKATVEFREKVMKRTPIWTRWPEDIPGSRPLEVALGEAAP